MKKTKALTIGLTGSQLVQLYSKTPKKNIFQRVGRGGLIFDYVKIGYVIEQLNKIFSPIGWDFETSDEKESTTEVFIKGKLTIKDHRGHQVTKTQYGQADKNKNVPVGDVYKAAASDALKKCASLLGLALDVYAGALEQSGGIVIEPTEVTIEKPIQKTSHLEQLKKELYKVGAKTEKEATEILNKQTGLKVDNLKMTEKHAQIVLLQWLQSKSHSTKVK